MRAISIILIPMFFLLIASSCKNDVAPPESYGALPSPSQLQWHEMEYFSLVCYGLNTYTEVEWAYGDVDPNLFTPSDLNTDQWAETAKNAGMKGLILVAKHHDGFCLWPSKFTDYSIESSPWKDGKGDVLGDLSKSCKKFGLKLGVYLSPWDRNHAEYGRAEYVKYYYDQLTELMTEYGDIYEFWIDGANGGTGYYGGTDESRSIDRKTYYGYDSIFGIVRKHQPNAVIFSDVGPGTRWVGNESGIGGETNWNTISTNGKSPGETDDNYRKKLQIGEEGGSEWIPAEVNTTMLWPKAWYYHTGMQPRSLTNLMDLYYTSIGRGSPLDLGLAIGPEGKITKSDSTALMEFKKLVDKEFETNIAEEAKISFSNIRGKSPDYGLKALTDDSKETYWATDDDIQTAYIELAFQESTEFNRLVLQEYIALGQRINKFSLEVKEGKEWKEIISGTTVGYKRALRVPKSKTKNIRITFHTNSTCLTLAGVGLYLAE